MTRHYVYQSIPDGLRLIVIDHKQCNHLYWWRSADESCSITAVNLPDMWRNWIIVGLRVIGFVIRQKLELEIIGWAEGWSHQIRLERTQWTQNQIKLSNKCFDSVIRPFGFAFSPFHVNHLTKPHQTSQFEHNSAIPNTFWVRKIIAARASRNLNFKSTAGCSLKVGACVNWNVRRLKQRGQRWLLFIA